MTSRIRIIILCVLLLSACHLFPQVRQFEDSVANQFDKRPSVAIMFIGNSRTFFNDMPFMVRKIADTAHSQKKYQIIMYAPGGTGLQDHWNDPKVQELLKQKWNYVVLQGRSNEQLDESVNNIFQTYGRKLVNAIRSGGGIPVLFVTWRYADGDPLYKNHPQLKTTLQDMMQRSYSELSQTTGTPMVNAGDAWQKLQRARPNMPLYYDTNHPGIYGSYLSALMFYRFFSHDDLGNVTYVPEGISAKDAEIIKSAAQAR